MTIHLRETTEGPPLLGNTEIMVLRLRFRLPRLLVVASMMTTDVEHLPCRTGIDTLRRRRRLLNIEEDTHLRLTPPIVAMVVLHLQLYPLDHTTNMTEGQQNGTRHRTPRLTEVDQGHPLERSRDFLHPGK